MKNQCSTQQLSFNFEFEQVSTAPIEVKKEIIVQQPKPVAKFHESRFRGNPRR